MMRKRRDLPIIEQFPFHVLCCKRFARLFSNTGSPLRTGPSLPRIIASLRFSALSLLWCTLLACAVPSASGRFSCTGIFPGDRRVRRLNNKMRLLPLIAATYFMVAGGPYGLEDILGDAGYGRALLLLLLIPIVWSLPTALMVGELASALAPGGRLLLLGPPRPRSILGISGGMALPRRQRLRHGHLSRNLRPIPLPCRTSGHRRGTRHPMGAGHRPGLRGMEPARCQGRR